ncbi:CPBP family intramembrane metalloprotease [Allokutzneria sp. A3M-2-11 16]|uniref:CPBP family intramembrane glutamic endopeptidase n=1 Tax=Allokutzneria sp. A3M-2-11 16 TaxID=2962043 RepID=UPI0020B8A3B1|nr:type II CAAX endopeptidase family protein [Allokutzneria sp. A3M-2-11 16]MCP3799622.1 CPBP family intramembrane metalloprotease [Allokutzneria sp. A3M-2-11 16]
MTNRLRSWLTPARPDGIETITDPARRRAVGIEVLLVFSITFGLSGARSLLSLLNSLMQPVPLSQQSVALNVSRSQLGLIDLLYQLLGVVQLLAWGALGVYLLYRAGVRLSSIGLDRTRRGRDLASGVGLAALIGVPGLVFYLVVRAIGLNLTVMPSTLNDVWWRAPVLILSAIANSWAEEVLVVGYLITRLRQLGWSENRSLLLSSVLRGSYHLYQGFGGFVGNIVMGLVYGRFWQRSQRLWALVAAHALIDTVAFVGYALLKGVVPWLP